MVQGIAGQILSETPSQPSAPVSAGTEESQEAQTPKQSHEGKEVPDFDSRFGVLTKMERKLKEEQARIKEQEKSWGDKLSKLEELEKFSKLFEENPLEALKLKKGWGVQEFNEFAVKHSTDEDLDPVSKLTKNFQTQLDELRSKMTEEFEGKIKAKEEEITAKDRERQVIEFKSELKSFLAENKNDYEFIHAEENGAEEVFNLIYEDLQRQIKENQESGEEKELQIMSIKDASDKVEAFLDKTYSKYLSLNKVKSKFQSGSEDLGRFIVKSQEPTTLNSSFSPKSKPMEQLSPEERKQQAIAFMRSQKTSA